MEVLDDIQEYCAQGVGGENARDCLMNVSSIVYQIRSELNAEIQIEKGE